MPPQMDPSMELIIRQWEMGYPNETARLRKNGTLLEHADRAAQRKAEVISACLERGMDYYQAQDVALSEWGMPPTLQGSSHREPEA